MMVRSMLSAAVLVAFVMGGVAAAQSKDKAMPRKAMAEKPVAAKTASRAFLHGYNLPASGVALEGYCPVCYLAAGKAAKGSPEFAADYNGVTYHFISEKVKQMFLASPQKYLPAYGGWCAIGIANGKNLPVDPTNFKVVNGRVMLFLRNKSIDALAMWNRGDEKAQTAAADAAWAKR